MVLEHLEAYLDWLQRRGRSRDTRRDYGSKLRQLGTWLQGRAIDDEILLEYRFWLQKEKPRPVSATSIHASFTAIRSFLDWLRRSGHPELTDGKEIDLPRREEPKRPRPTDGQVAAMFRQADRLPQSTFEKRYQRAQMLALLAILAYTGLRRREMLELKTDDLRQVGTDWEVYVRCGKGAQPRRVDVGSGGYPHLETYLRVRAEWCDHHARADLDFWPLDRRRNLGDRGLTDRLRDLAELTGIPPRAFPPHAYRRWFAVSTLRSSDLETTRQALGHAHIATTAIYLSSDPETRRKAAEAVSRLAGTVPAKAAPPAGERRRGGHRAAARRRHLPPPDQGRLFTESGETP